MYELDDFRGLFISGERENRFPIGGLSNVQGRENLTLHANNKGGDQPVHQRSLISASLVHIQNLNI